MKNLPIRNQKSAISNLEAEGEGFEPPVGVNPQLFSRQPP
jgi:hypothetical protein